MRLIRIFLISRIALSLVGLLAMSASLPSARTLQTPLVSRYRLLDLWSHFDGTWYLQIARDGYLTPAHGIANVVFSPLLPMLMAIGERVLGNGETGLLISGLLISNAALIVAMIYLHRLVLLDFEKEVADRAVLFALLFPTTLFLSALYPMSLMLAIAISSMYYARRGCFARASLIAAFAPLTRPDGVLLVVPLLMEWLHQRRNPGDVKERSAIDMQPRLRDLLTLSLIPAALGCWLGYLHHRFGDALIFVHAQTSWATWDWPAVIRALPLSLGAWGVVTMLLILLGSLVISFAQLRASYGIYLLTFSTLSLFSGRLASMPRFALVLFPVYIALALVGRHARIRRVLVCTSAAVAIALMVKFAVFSFAG